MATYSFSIVIPTYNSSRTVGIVCNEIFGQEPDAQIVIVDDNSPDGTGRIVDAIAADHPAVKVLHRAKKLGVGSAVHDGVLAAASEIVVLMDSDLHHSVADLPGMIKLIQNGYDIVIASRYIKGSKFVCSSLRRLLVNKLGNIIAHQLMGIRVRDCTHGFRAYRRSVFLSCYDKSSTDGTYNLVVLASALKQGYKVAEIPCHSFHSGKSNAQFAFRYFTTVALIAAGRLRGILLRNRDVA
jgi:dolichol-phosphate mannosyltransferase